MKCIDRKNMVPLSKVFYAASLNSNYLKVLNDFSFSDKIYRIVKEDKTSAQNSLSKLTSPRSEFGEPNANFY